MVGRMGLDPVSFLAMTPFQFYAIWEGFIERRHDTWRDMEMMAQFNQIAHHGKKPIQRGSLIRLPDRHRKPFDREGFMRRREKKLAEWAEQDRLEAEKRAQEQKK